MTPVETGAVGSSASVSVFSSLYAGLAGDSAMAPFSHLRVGKDLVQTRAVPLLSWLGGKRPSGFSGAVCWVAVLGFIRYLLFTSSPKEGPWERLPLCFL